jgi:hypothetical protein
MKDLASLRIPKVETMKIQIVPPDRVVLEGTIAFLEPVKELGAFFSEVHTAAVAAKLMELKLDVARLTFVNSSAIRLFIDWTTWLKNERGHRYVLRFLASRHITWQKTSFMALSSLAKGALALEYID